MPAVPGNALAVQSLSSSGFKVIAGWKSQHHAYASESSSTCSSTHAFVREYLLEKAAQCAALLLRLDVALSDILRVQITSRRSLWTPERPGN